MGGIKSGATGCILLLPAVFITIIITILAMVNPALIIASPLWYSILGIVGGFIFTIGALLIAAGMMKLGKYYRDTVSKVAGIVGLVTGILELVANILALVVIFAPVIAVASFIVGIVATILLIVTLILIGVAFIVVRNKIGRSGLALGTGIMAIISGATLIILVGFFILIPTAICAAVLFMKAEGVPSKEAPKEGKKLAVKAVEAKPKKQKPADVEAEVYKYVKSHPSGIDVADCAESLGVSEGEVQKSINALVKKGKLELG